MKTLPVAKDFQSEARRIDERRPPWVLRATLYSVLAVIACAISWAALAKIDRIVVAPGKLVTTAPTIVLGAFDTAVIRTLDVKVGEVVHKGQHLATLDATFSEADAAQLRDKIFSLSAEVDRLEAELHDRPYLPVKSDEDGRLQASIWAKSMEEYHAKVDSLDQQVRQVEAEIATKEADEQALTRRLGVAQQLESMRAELMRQQTGSKIAYLEAESHRMQIQRDIELDANAQTELKDNANRLVADKTAYIADFRRKVGDELVAARREKDTATKELEKANRRNAVTILKAPADAVVLDVANVSVGSVLKSAQPLYTLVPLDSPLQAEVKVSGDDVGHVSVHETARVKLAAWPFQKYGTLPGEVETLSENSFDPNTSKDGQKQEQIPFYRARVKLLSDNLRGVPSDFRLLPGMAVTAEIKVGKHSILSYFLYPLEKDLNDAIREP